MIPHPKYPLHDYIEVAWIEVESIDVRSDINASETFDATIDLSHFHGKGINIIGIPNIHQDLLMEKFKLREYLPNAPTLVIKKNQSLGAHPIRGCVDFSRRAFAIEDSSFGIIKSVVSGIASIQAESDGWTPAHAACINILGKTTLLIGGSKAGKTTAIFELAKLCHKQKIAFSILTDDWLNLCTKNGKVLAKTFDPTISIDKQVILNYRNLLNLNPAVVDDIVNAQRKHCAPASTVIHGASECQDYWISPFPSCDLNKISSN